MKTCLDLDLEVDYTYYKGYPGNREEPPEPPYIEITSVRYNTHELLPSLKEDDYEHLLEACWEDYEDSKDYGYE